MSFTTSSAFDNSMKSSPPVSNVNTLYVGGNGTGNYTKIQDAIDNASDGDTVFVFDDSSPYYEYIVISKRINLTGENKETTIIVGNWSRKFIPVVILNAYSSFVTIQGFIITNGYCGIDIESDNNKITGNIISNNTNGVGLYYCCNNTILGNNISSNSEYGVKLVLLSNYNIIQNNNIQNNYIGISLAELCLYNIIMGNNISKNSYESIILGVSHENIIESNYIENIKILGSGNLIRKNNFIGNIKHVQGAVGRNFWDANYWGDWIGLKFNLPIFQKFPKIILCWILPLGVIFNIPYFCFDWHPAKEPYELEV